MRTEQIFGRIKRKIATLLIVILTVQMVLPSLTMGGTQSFAAENKNVIDITGKGTPGKIFNKIEVSLGTTVKGDDFNQLSMYFDFNLANSEIQNQLEDFIKKGYISETPGRYDQELKEAFENGNITAPSFTCTLNKNVIDVAAVQAWLAQGNSKMITDQNEHIATLSLTNGENGPMFLVQMEPIVYNRKNVRVFYQMDLDLLNKYEQGTTVEVKKGQSGADIEITVNGGGLPVATDSDYSISKELKEGSVDESSIFVYEISAKAIKNTKTSLKATSSNTETSPAEGDIELLNDLFTEPVEAEKTEDTKDMLATNHNMEDAVVLNGTFISDTLPDGLKLVKAEVSLNGKGYVEISGADLGAYYENGVFAYQVPSDKGDITTCNVRLYTTLTSDLWAEYYKKNALTKKFKNYAFLYDSTQDTILNYSKPVESDIKWSSMLTKDGMIVEGNQTAKWTIKVDSHFSPGVQLYLVDHIGNIENTHNYMWEGDKAEIQIGNETETVERLSLTPAIIEAIGGLENLQYNKEANTPTIDTIKKLLEQTGNENAYNSGKHFAYEYQNGNVKDAVMLLSVAEHANKTLTISYDTEITAKSNVGGEYNTNVSNDVKAVWKWEEGKGPGEGYDGPWGSATVSKGTNLKVDIATKTAGNYVEAGRIIPWNFGVNETGVAMKWFRMEDTLPRGLSWINLKAGENLTIKDTKGGERTLTYATWSDAWPDDAAKDVYMFRDKVVRIQLGEITADQCYKFTLNSTVKDEGFAQGAPAKFTNKAIVTAQIGEGNPFSKDLDATHNVNNERIKKEVVPFKTGDIEHYYDYENNRVQWKIFINPRKLAITGATITDTMPVGTRNAILVSAKAGNQVGRVDNGAKKITFEDVSLSWTEQDRNLVFSFGSKDGTNKSTTISDCYELVFTTDVTEEFRRKNFKSKQEIKLQNHVELKGNINGVDITNATATAESKIMPQPMLKEGTYTGLPPAGQTNLTYPIYDSNGNRKETNIAAAFAEWTVYVNRTKADYTGVEIRDQLQDVFELLPTTMVISTVDIDSTGKEIPGSEVPIYRNPNPKMPATVGGNPPLEAFTLDEREFAFLIPADYKNATLKLTFKTIVVDDAAAALMTNQISAKGEDFEDRTDYIKAKNAKDFTLAQYATAQGMLYLQITKKSTKTDNGKPVYLSGAKFEIQEMKLLDGKSGNDIQNWVVNEAVAPKERVTSSQGNAAFIFLNPDVIYRIIETASPEGYLRANKTWYTAILKSGDRSEFPDNVKDAVDTQNGTYDIEIEADVAYFVETIENMPVAPGDYANEFVIQKKNPSGQLLSNVTFSLYDNGFFVKQGVTNEEGTITFSDIAPLEVGRYYTLTENTPFGYKPAESYRVYVTTTKIDGKDTFEIKITSEDGTSVAVENGKYIIVNTPDTKTGSFTKTDQNGKTLINPSVTFQVLRKGDGGRNIGTDENPTYIIDMNSTGTTYESYLPLPEVSTTEGIVELKDLYYGEYQLVEQPETGDTGTHVVEKLADPIFLQVRKDGMYAQDDNKAYTINLDNPGNLKVVNKLKAGQIQVKKVAGDAVGNSGHPITKPLEGVVFVIRKSGEDTPFLTLKTNAEGSFTRNADGSYTDANTGEKKSLLLGNYTLTETEAPVGFQIYKKSINFSVTMENWNQVQYAVFDGRTDAEMVVNPTGVLPKFYNLPSRGTVSLIKQDEASSHDLDGAVFLAYADEEGTMPVAFIAQSKSGEPYGIAGGQLLEALKKQFPSITLVTSQNGMAPSSGNDSDGYGLLYGTYYLKEIRAPYGYQLSTDVYRVTVDDPANSITIGNKRGNAGFAIHKTVEVLNEDLTPSTQKADGKDFVFLITGNAQAGGGSQPIQRLESLRIDGRTLASANNAQAVAQGLQVTTGADGKVELSGIPVGTYTIKEIGGPNFAHYVSVPERTVTISQSDKQDKLEVSEAVVSFHNQQKRRDLSGRKKDQDGGMLAGAVFGLYAADGAIRYRTAVSGSDGTFTFTSIPTGSYVVKEVEAPEGYLLNPANTWQVTVGTESTTPVSLGSDIINVLIRGNIAGRKTDTFDKPLSGATMGLFPAETTSFIQGNLFQGRTAISGEDGQFIFEQVPYGTYRVAELNAPNGYILNRTLSYLVTITENGQTVNTGLRRENGKEEGTQPEAITITNKKNSGGNGGGDTTPPTTPTNPTTPGTPEVGPGVPPTTPVAPTEPTVPTSPTTPVIPPTIPFDPENPVIDVPGNPPRVEIRDPDNNVIYDGPGSGVNIGGWGPGEYQIVTFDDADVPLGSMTFTIDDAGIPLAFGLPKTGDRSIPYAMLATIMLGALGGIGGILYKRKREQEMK